MATKKQREKRRKKRIARKMEVGMTTHGDYQVCAVENQTTSPAYNRKTHSFAHILNQPEDKNYKYDYEDYFEASEDVVRPKMQFKSLMFRAVGVACTVAVFVGWPVLGVNLKNVSDLKQPNLLPAQRKLAVISVDFPSGDMQHAVLAQSDMDNYARAWKVHDGLSEASIFNMTNEIRSWRYELNPSGVKAEVDSHYGIGFKRVVEASFKSVKSDLSKSPDEIDDATMIGALAFDKEQRVRALSSIMGSSVDLYSSYQVDPATVKDQTYLCFNGEKLFKFPNPFNAETTAKKLNAYKGILSHNEAVIMKRYQAQTAMDQLALK